MKHKIIYIPGLGDGYDPLRARALRLWESRDVAIELAPMQWYAGDAYERVFDGVHQLITQSQKDGYAVSLVGESAGGSMAIDIFAAHPTVHRLVTIAGVNSPHAPVAQYIRDKAPAFDGALRALSTSLAALSDTERTRIINFTARADSTVSPKHSHIAGAKHRTVPMIGHLTTVAYCLTLGRKRIIHSITR